MTLGREQPLPEDFWTAHTTTAPKSDDNTGAAPSGTFLRDITADLPYGVGMGPDAAIWPLYNEEAEKLDRDMVETQNGGMENLLVFAALFSAIVTAFLIQSLPLLQPNSGDATVDALRAISAQLGSLSSGTTAPSPPYQAAAFHLSAAGVTMNLLWVSSLFLSLYMSVTAMLVKQWLRVYITDLPSSPKDKAVERQRRCDGLRKWGVTQMADSLWTWIHVAVALFLIGFIIYLWTLYLPLGAVMLVFFGIASMNYISLAAAPLVWPYCPFTSPLTRILRGQQEFCIDKLRKLRHLVAKATRGKTTNDLQDKTPLADPMAHGFSVPSKDAIRSEEEAVGWLCRTSSNPQTIKAILAACFSWQDQVLLTVDEVTCIGRARARSISLPNALSPSPGAHDVTKLPWINLRSLLIEQAMVYSLYWNVDARVEQMRPDWAWPYPLENIPEAEQFLYYALLCYCSGSGPALLAPSQQIWMKRAIALLEDGLRECTPGISLLGVTFFLKFLGRDTTFTFTLTAPRLEEQLMDLIASSLSLPVEFLCACNQLWGRRTGSLSEDTQTELMWSTTSRASPDAMRDFFIPLIESDHHSILAHSSMILATNELRAGIPSCFEPRRGLSSLLKWFRAHGFFYPERRSPLQDSDIVRQQHPCETELLRQCIQACRNGPGRQMLLLPQDSLDIGQLFGLDSELWQPCFPSSYWLYWTDDDLASGAPALLSLCQAGLRYSDSRALLICTTLLASILDTRWWINQPPSTVSACEKLLSTWLHWITEPVMLSTLLLTDSRRHMLRTLLRNISSGAKKGEGDASRMSIIVDMLRSWHTIREGNEDLMKDDKFRVFIDEFDERMGRRYVASNANQLFSESQSLSAAQGQSVGNRTSTFDPHSLLSGFSMKLHSHVHERPATPALEEGRSGHVGLN